MIDIDHLVQEVENTVASHNLGKDGEYARWLWQDPENSRELGINEYGCADAANILYTLNDFITDPHARCDWVSVLQKMQNQENGTFNEATHHFIHTTAHCTAALELFDAQPLVRIKEYEQYLSKDALYAFLDSLDWCGDPWPQSHRGAGLYAAAKLTGMVSKEWEDWYFDWFWDKADPQTGLWRRGCVMSGQRPVFEHMASTFHYLFNHEYAKRPLRYPDKMIDTCIDLYNNHALKARFGEECNFIEVDWVYCLNRALRQSPHRFGEAKMILKKFSNQYLDYLISLEKKSDDEWNDLHMLFGVVCCIAELQQALPGHIISSKPLRLVLDRRPFI